MEPVPLHTMTNIGQNIGQNIDQSTISSVPPNSPLVKKKISTSLKMLHEKIDHLQNSIQYERDVKDMRTQMLENDAAHNLYSSTKSIGQQFLNISVITNYIQILVNIFAIPITSINRFDIALIILISLSMINQGLIFIIVTVLYKGTNEQITQNCTATMLNNLVTTLTAVTVVLNIPITVLISTKVTSGNTTII